jgi:hypothetical protein
MYLGDTSVPEIYIAPPANSIILPGGTAIANPASAFFSSSGTSPLGMIGAVGGIVASAYFLGFFDKKKRR